MGEARSQDVAGVVIAPPRYRSVPPFVRSLGPEAVAWAERNGIDLDDHQQLVLDSWMGQDKNGAWTSFENALIEPRQNGKSEILIVRCLFGVFELAERHVVFSAHMWATAHEGFLRAMDIIESNEVLSARVKKTRRSAADLGFVLDGGERLRFLTRSRGTARGFAGDVIVFDEAHFLAEATHSALLPSLSARSIRGKTQVFYGSSAADQTRHPDSLVIARIRERGIRGDDPSLAFLEWSAEVLDGEGNEVLPDRVPDSVAADVEVQRAANPALGIRISEEHVAFELRALDRRSYACERLGVGDWATGDGQQAGPIDIGEWMSLVDEDSKPNAPVCIAFDVSPDRRVAIAIAGRRDDGFFHVEIADARQGTAFLIDRIVQLHNDHDPHEIVADAYGLGGVLIDKIEEAGVPVRRVTGQEHAQACGLILDLISEQTVRHLGSMELVEAIKGAGTRPLSDAWVWSRKSSAVDISPLVAATLALWASSGSPETPHSWDIF